MKSLIKIVFILMVSVTLFYFIVIVLLLLVGAHDSGGVEQVHASDIFRR